jgi:hypothetical protein
MAQINEVARPGPGEESPLLGEAQARGVVGVNGAAERVPETASPSGETDTGRANQKVGKIRGFLIILSVWGLIFLQGKSPSCALTELEGMKL